MKDLLMNAIKRLDVNEVENILKTIRADEIIFYCQNCDHDQSPIHYAASQNLSEIVALIVSKNPASILAKDKVGNTALHYAIYRGHEVVAEKLCATATESSLINNLIASANHASKIPLHCAALVNNLNIVNVLLAADCFGISIEKQDFNGLTPLHHAAKKGYVSMVNLMIEKNPQAVVIKDIHGGIPLHYASVEGFDNIVDLLINSNLQTTQSQDIYGATPLHYAAAEGHCSVVKILANNNYKILNMQDYQGCTPLHWATDRRQFEVINIILTDIYPLTKIQKDTLIMQQDEQGNTALHSAAQFCYNDIVKILSQHSFKVFSIPNKQGYTALDVAWYYERYETMKTILLGNNPVFATEKKVKTQSSTIDDNKQLTSLLPLMDAKEDRNSTKDVDYPLLGCEMGVSVSVSHLPE